MNNPVQFILLLEEFVAMTFIREVLACFEMQCMHRSDDSLQKF